MVLKRKYKESRILGVRLPANIMDEEIENLKITETQEPEEELNELIFFQNVINWFGRLF